MDINGKIAVVTGVSKGIGKATVEALLAAGAVVAGWGRTSPEIQHPDFHFFEADVRNVVSVNEAYKQTMQKLGKPVSVLVNNAGLGIRGSVGEIQVADWEQMWQTNVSGIILCTQAVLPGMKELLEGHIINISSIAGLNGVEHMSGYCATKYAVRGLSQSWFKELRPFGIKVTCIYPGSVNTHFFDDMPGVVTGDHMMQASDIASTIMHCINSPRNYHHIDIEVRPLAGAPALPRK